MSNPFGLRAEIREYAYKCYGGYMNMCRDRGVKPVPFHKFSEAIHKGHNTKQTYKLLHEQEGQS